ncbi:zf-CCHC domain-containing protein, partial [Cephalotus follicularis]
TFSKFFTSSDKLDRLLGVQRCVFDRAGLGFNKLNTVKHFEILLDRKKIDNVVSCKFCGKNGHIPSKCWNKNHLVSCNFCGKIGHISSVCWHRKYRINVKTIWVLKGSIPTNLK